MENRRPVYLDAAATTRADPAVVDLACRLMLEGANAGSRTHEYGAAALAHLSEARRRIAEVAGCLPQDVVFTSGATEASNMAIQGLASQGRASGSMHLVSTAIEHKATLEPLARLQRDGFSVTLVPPRPDGSVSADEVLTAVRPDTLLVTMMHANNETGAVLPVDDVAAGLNDDGPLLHVDAAQTFGRLEGGYRHPRVDLVSASGHKTYAPMGIGCLIMRRSTRRMTIDPLGVGGGQERGHRAGTVPVPLAAAFGLAASIAWRERRERLGVCKTTRAGALSAFSRLRPCVHGGDPVLPNILSVSFPGVDSEALMVSLKDLAALSNGSACTSASYEPSHVLSAMGLNEDELEGTVRFSWSHAEVDVPWKEIADRIGGLQG